MRTDEAVDAAHLPVPNAPPGPHEAFPRPFALKNKPVTQVRSWRGERPTHHRPRCLSIRNTLGATRRAGSPRARGWGGPIFPAPPQAPRAARRLVFLPPPNHGTSRATSTATGPHGSALPISPLPRALKVTMKVTTAHPNAICVGYVLGESRSHGADHTWFAPVTCTDRIRRWAQRPRRMRTRSALTPARGAAEGVRGTGPDTGRRPVLLSGPPPPGRLQTDPGSCAGQPWSVHVCVCVQMPDQSLYSRTLGFLATGPF